MKKVEVELTGKCGLLHHRFQEAEHGLETSKAKKKVYVPEEEANKSLYKNEDGSIYQPSEHILGALIKSGTTFKFEGKKTYKDIMKADIVVEPDNIPLLNIDGTPKTTYDEIDSRGVVIQRARITRCRPKFNEWKINFTIEIIDDENLSVSTLKEIMEKAGKIGIGDYRPRFGRFIVTSFQEV